ncbi:MAG: PilZ domain-containing protein [Nitrospirae bacterium]|nr:PilZ domain-containing protein [Nitrospirota bacterium]
MQDIRRHKRVPVDDIELTGKMMFATEVRVIDISVGGISLKADRRLNIGCEYSLKIEDSGRLITIKGIVVWSSMSGTRQGPKGDVIPIYTAGLKFTNVLSDRISELIHFIEDHKIDGELRLSGLRFNIDDPERAILNIPADYKVKEISLSGMLIESAQALEIDSRHPMEIFVPEDSQVKFTGRVASCLLIEKDGPEHFDIGIEFSDMHEKDRERLKGLIRFLRSLDKNSSSGS